VDHSPSTADVRERRRRGNGGLRFQRRGNALIQTALSGGGPAPTPIMDGAGPGTRDGVGAGPEKTTCAAGTGNDSITGAAARALSFDDANRQHGNVTIPVGTAGDERLGGRQGDGLFRAMTGTTSSGGKTSATTPATDGGKRRDQAAAARGRE